MAVPGEGRDTQAPRLIWGRGKDRESSPEQPQRDGLTGRGPAPGCGDGQAVAPKEAGLKAECLKLTGSPHRVVPLAVCGPAHYL